MSESMRFSERFKPRFPLWVSWIDNCPVMVGERPTTALSIFGTPAPPRLCLKRVRPEGVTITPTRSCRGSFPPFGR